MKKLLSLLIFIHGLIHSFGFLSAFKIADFEGLYISSRVFGILWLATGILFVLSSVLLVMNKRNWCLLTLIALLISQILVFIAWSDAAIATLINCIILMPVIITLAEYHPKSFRNQFRNAVEKRLAVQESNNILSENDILHLPEPVQKYLRYTGSVGKEIVTNFYAEFRGGIKPNPQANFLTFNSRQYNFLGDRARFFIIESNMFGIPFDGLHTFCDRSAVMNIKIASLFNVVNAKGEKMNQSETVTLFNDVCLLAPSHFISQDIEWEIIDNLTVKAIFTNKDITISATLYFNNFGELINFISDDRFESSDGKTYNNYRWSTPVKDYIEIDGRKFPSYGETIWHKPEGDFCYGKFNLNNIKVNQQTFI